MSAAAAVRRERRRHRRGIRGVSIIAVLAALASIAIVFAVGFASFREFATSQHAREDLIYSSTIRADLQFIYEQILTAESAARGFVITGEPEFLPPLKETRDSILQRIKQLAEFAVERPEHAALLTELTRLTDEELRLLQEMVAARTGPGASAATMLQVRRGKEIMDRIAATVQDISDAEIASIAARTREVRIVGQRTKQTLIALLAAAIAVVAASTLIVIAHLIGRRRAEQALGDTLSRHRAILASAMDSIITVNGAGQIETANPATSRLLGWTQEELVARHLGLLFQIPEGTTEEAFLETLTAAARDGGEVRELVGLRKDGSTVPVDVAIGEMRSSGGDALVAVLHDITERKRAEVMKNEFVSTVSHELRTPLTSIAGSLGLLAGGATGELPAAAQRLVTIASQNSRRLVRLINDILDIEKMQSASMTFAREPLVLAEVAQRAIEQTSGFALEHEVSLTLQVGADETPVTGDGDRLIQVLTNLISNAVKFSPAGSAVEVSVERHGDSVRASVCDHGTGIPDSFRDAIFTRFAQADNSDTRQRGGTGLGLAIAKEIVDRHGGTLAFESEMGVGTTFRMDLPAGAGAAARTHPAPAPAAIVMRAGAPVAAASLAVAPVALASAAGAPVTAEPISPPVPPPVVPAAPVSPVATPAAPATPALPAAAATAVAVPSALAPTAAADVLLVEDDLDAAAVLSALLTQAGLSTHVSGSAAGGERHALAGDYRVILVDLVLPDRDGISLIRAMRRAGGRPVPVLVVSARPRGALANGEAEALQILDWMDKPLDPAAVIAAMAPLHSGARAAGAKRPAVLHLDPDPAARAVVQAALAEVADVCSAPSIAVARAALAAQDFDAAIVDLALSGAGLDLLPHLRRHDGEKLPVMISSPRDDDAALARRVKGLLSKSHVSLDLLSATVRRLAAPPPEGPA